MQAQPRSVVQFRFSLFFRSQSYAQITQISAEEREKSRARVIPSPADNEGPLIRR